MERGEFPQKEGLGNRPGRGGSRDRPVARARRLSTTAKLRGKFRATGHGTDRGDARGSDNTSNAQERSLSSGRRRRCDGRLPKKSERCECAILRGRQLRGEPPADAAGSRGRPSVAATREVRVTL